MIEPRAPDEYGSIALFSGLGDILGEVAKQTFALASEGARQSPRGDSDPPEEIFGQLGSAERLNWLAKKRTRKTESQCRISPS